jgi:hypothetical protein
MNETLAFFLTCLLVLAVLGLGILVLTYFPDKGIQLLFMGIIGVCIAMFLVLFFPNHCSIIQQEGFEDSSKQSFIITMCPESSKNYTDKHGNSNCCEGEVSGSICHGKVLCTFSGSAQNKYPICGNPGRRQKWFGAIDGWVKEYMKNDCPTKFQQFLEYINQGYLLLDQPEIKNRIDSSIKEEVKELLEEEKEWFQSAKQDKPISFQEEIMYILSRVITITSKVKNMGEIQSHIQSKILKQCTTIH